MPLTICHNMVPWYHTSSDPGEGERTGPYWNLYWTGTYWNLYWNGTYCKLYWTGTYYFLIGDCQQFTILERDLLLFDRFLLTILYTGTGPTTFLIGCVGIFCLFVPRSILEWDLLLFYIYVRKMDTDSCLYYLES